MGTCSRRSSEVSNGSRWLVGLLLLVGCGGGAARELSGVEVELPDGSELEFPAEVVHFDNDRGESLLGVLIYPESSGPESSGPESSGPESSGPESSGAEPTGALPMVIVLHGAGGLFSTPDSNDTELELPPQFSEWAAMFTRSGYAVLFPSSYYSRGFFEWDDRPGGLDTTERLIFRVYDAYAALTFACAQTRIDCERVGVLGFSNGASATGLVLHEHLDDVTGMEALTPAGERPGFALGVAYYPGCGFKSLVSLGLESPSEFYFPTAPLWIHHGDRDPLVENCELRVLQTDELTALRGLEQNPMELIVHTGSGHGFDSSPDNDTEVQARDQARAFTMGLFTERL